MARGPKPKSNVSAPSNYNSWQGVLLACVVALIASLAWFRFQKVVNQHISTAVDSSLTLLEEGKADAAVQKLTKTRNIGIWFLGDGDSIIKVSVHYALGRAFMETNRTQDAASEFEHVVALDPQHWAAQANLGSALFLRMNYPEALGAFQESISAIEESTFALNPPLGPSEERSTILAELYLQKGVVLLELPKSRCAGATCTEYAAQALRQAQILNPELHLASQLLAKATVDLQSNAASSKAYIKALFDE